MRPPSGALLAPLIVSSALFMETLDATVITTALPDMARSFGRNPVELSIGITVYVLTLAIFIPVSGWVADRYGARSVFRTAIALFTLSSVACGFSTGLVTFTAARIVQGIGGAMMVPVGRLIVLRLADKHDLVRAIATLSTPALLGPVLGPPLGGFIATYASWRWIFFINVPIGVLGIVLVTRYIAELREVGRRPLDVTGFLLTGAALAFLIYGLDRLGAAAGGGVLGPLALVGAGLALGWLALRHARRRPDALLDLSLMRLQTFASTITGGSLFRVALGGAPFLTPLLLQVGFGKSAFQAGLLILAGSLGNVATRTVSTPILRAIGFRTALVASGLLTALSLLACCLFTARTPDGVIVAVLFVNGVVRAVTFTCLNTIAFADVRPEGMSGATSFSSMAQQVSLGLGVAVGAILLQLSPAARVLLGGDGGVGEGIGGGLPDVTDFRIAFVATSLFAFASVLFFRALPRSAGAEVSGHRPKP